MNNKLPRDDDGKLSAYAWPGGYDILYLDKENNVLCADCANVADQDKEDWPDFAPVAYFILQDTDTEGEWCNECNRYIGAYEDEPAIEEENEWTEPEQMPCPKCGDTGLMSVWVGDDWGEVPCNWCD